MDKFDGNLVKSDNPSIVYKAHLVKSPGRSDGRMTGFIVEKDDGVRKHVIVFPNGDSQSDGLLSGVMIRQGSSNKEYVRGMMQAQQGGLPYDSMVKYLQTDGNQYIDTGLDTALDAVSYNNIFDVEFVTIGTSSNVYSVSYPNAAIQIYTFDKRIYNQGAFLVITTGVKYTINAGTTSTARSIRIGSNFNQQYFSRPINDEKRIYILGVPPAANTAGSVAKIYNYKIFKNSAEIFDAIPVRVGTVGYMYDRVSGQLFGNDGTGSFVLGPDIQ